MYIVNDACMFLLLKLSSSQKIFNLLVYWLQIHMGLCTNVQFFASKTFTLSIHDLCDTKWMLVVQEEKKKTFPGIYLLFM